MTLRGWVRTARHSKGVSFLEVSDGSCFAGLQVVAAPELENFETELRHLQTGCAVSVVGEVVDSPGKGQRFELQAQRIDVVGTVAEDYPLQKKRHSFEFLRTLAHLRPRTNTLGAVFRVRNAASAAVHEFFQERDFLLLHTPIITSSDAEGAGQMFRVSTLDAGDPQRAENRSVDFEQDFFATRDLPHGLRAAPGRDRGARALRQGLHLRPHLPRREVETPAATWRSSG